MRDEAIQPEVMTGLLRVARNDEEVGRTPAYQPRPPRQKSRCGGGANSAGWR